MDAKKKKFLQALKEAKGIVADACAMMGIKSRQTYYNWIEKDEEFALECENIREDAIDYVEGQLLRNVKEGKETSIIFYLKTQAKHRGYIESSEQIVKGEYNIISDKAVNEEEWEAQYSLGSSSGTSASVN